MSIRTAVSVRLMMLFAGRGALASGHGPVFGAATPTLGRGVWSIDQAWTIRFGEQSTREHMLETMVTFGITEILQASVSVPELMSDNRLAPARMMNAMSNDRELEGLIGYRFHRTPVGIGGWRESTVYVGGTIPFERNRFGTAAGGSLIVSAAPDTRGAATICGLGARCNITSPGMVNAWETRERSPRSTGIGHRSSERRTAGLIFDSSSNRRLRIDSVASRRSRVSRRPHARCSSHRHRCWSTRRSPFPAGSNGPRINRNGSVRKNGRGSP